LIHNCSGLSHIIIPRDIEILGSLCFCECTLLSSISFESNSRLKRIESQAFSACHPSIVIPSTVLFVASDAAPDLSQLSLSDPDSCPTFDRWRRLRKLGITVISSESWDLRAILLVSKTLCLIRPDLKKDQ
jgi:hypothetical protein